MCGISGIISFDKSIIKDNDVDSLNSSLSHRGPDGEGAYLSPNRTVALAHKRLSIIDVSDMGKQPMSYLDKYYITLNGEIYNYKELKKELSNSGYSFKSESDTEVLLACYDAWGESMLHRLNGMWAFAIFSVENNSVFLSRDRYGVKPLYYYFDKKKFVFSSEVQSIKKYLGEGVTPNQEVLKGLSKGLFSHHGSEETYIQGVMNLRGGYSISILNQQVDIKKWYSISKIKVPHGINKQASELRKLIIDSCKLRLRSDVPIGTCLSGGIDSGSITSIINNDKFPESEFAGNNTHKSFCASFPGTPIDEGEAAKKLAEEINAEIEILSITAPTISELEEAMYACDGPMHAMAFFPIWKLYKFIREKNITVTLDGQGPDEMLGGYTPLKEALWASLELKKPWWFYEVFRAYSAQGESSQVSSKKYAKQIVRNILVKDYKTFVIIFLKQFGLFRKKEISLYCKGDYNNSLDNCLYEQFFISPLPAILNQYDRCSMAHAIECRMPFMDYRVVEFIFSLPPASKVGKGYTKLVLRKAMKGILPDRVRLNKKKIGFNAPIVDWFRGELKVWMLQQMKSETFQNSRYFNGREILSKFERFLENPSPGWDDAWAFWPPVHLSWWLNKNKFD